MQLSKKQKNFSEFLFAFLKFRSTLEHFEEKYDPHSLYICKIRDCERRH